MIKKSTAYMAMSLFVFSLLSFVWSCENPGPVVKNDGRDSITNLNVRLTSLDSLGNKRDTIYRIKLVANDTAHIEHIAYCESKNVAYSEPPKTGGSSPSTIHIDIWKDRDDKP